MTLPSLSNDDVLYARVDELKADGIAPYAVNFIRSRPLYQINEDYEAAGYEYESERVALSLCGRVTKKTSYGDKLLVMIEDQDAHFQLLLDPDYLDEKSLDTFRNSVYRGDYLGFEVDYICRVQDRVTARVIEWKFLALCLLSLPTLVNNSERQRRQRYLHLAGNIDAREHFIKRSRILRCLRNFLAEKEFLEVNTPSAHRGEVSDGYMESLLVGGIEKIYEIRQHLSSKASDWQHFPDAQMLHFCMVPADLYKVMRVTEQMIHEVCMQLYSTPVIYWKSHDRMSKRSDEPESLGWTSPEDDLELSLTPSWPRRSLYEMVADVTGIDFAIIEHMDDAIEAAQYAGLDCTDSTAFNSVDDVAWELFYQLVSRSLVQPVFVVAPMRMPHDEDHSVQRRERFQLYINGIRFAEGYSGFNDPQALQASRSGMDTQSNRGVQQPEPRTEEQLTMLKYGLPPSASVTLHIDRLVMMMTGASHIQDVIWFPTL